MRVALVVRALPVHRPGGLEYHTWDLANALQELGCAVTVITSAHPEGRQHELLESGVEVVYLRKGAPGDYSLAFFRGVEEAVAQLDASERFDVIHAQEFAGIGLKARPGRFVATVHGTLTTETPLDRRYWRHLSQPQRAAALGHGAARLALVPAFRRMLRRADRLAVDSHFTEGELLRSAPWLAGRIAVVPLGVDSRRYHLPRAPQARPHGGPLRIVMLGRVQPMRGFMEMLTAAYRLHWDRVDFEIRVGGTETPEGWFEAAISEFLVEDRVRYEGRIPPAEVSSFFDWGDVFLFADRTQPAFGLACVEAMLHGLPVLATRVGAVPEVVTDDVGWLWEPWHAQDLRSQLVRITSQPALLAAKAERAWHYARQFTSHRMARATLELYTSLSGSGKLRTADASAGTSRTL
jgi:glycosyltransferase involved in cell wall biosynthesis